MQKIGLVGLGFMGNTHLDAYKHVENAEVAAICTSSKGDEITRKFNGSIVSDYEDLLRNNDIDIIDICVPTYLHEEYILKAAQAGKHIFCEKPLTLSLKSAYRIAEEVYKSGVALFVGHVLRFWPEYQTIKSYIEKDKLTDLQFIHAQRLGQFPAWSNWFQYPEKSGGALYDLHIHDIDFVYYLLGEPQSVYAVGSQNKYGAWDHVMTTLTFKNKTRAFVEASHKMPNGYPFTMSFRAHGKNALLDLNIMSGENIEKIDNSMKKFTYYDNRTAASVELGQKDAFRNQLTYFVNCIENKKENKIIPLDDVIYVIKLLTAIEESLKTGQKVAVSKV